MFYLGLYFYRQRVRVIALLPNNFLLLFLRVERVCKEFLKGKSIILLYSHIIILLEYYYENIITFNNLFLVVTVHKIDANKTRRVCFDRCNRLGRVTVVQINPASWGG